MGGQDRAPADAHLGPLQHAQGPKVQELKQPGQLEVQIQTELCDLLPDLLESLPDPEPPPGPLHTHTLLGEIRINLWLLLKAIMVLVENIFVPGTRILLLLLLVLLPRSLVGPKHILLSRTQK